MTVLTDDEAVRHVQTRLKATNHFDGWVGGNFGRLTQAAFLAAVPKASAWPALPELPTDDAAVRWMQAGFKALGHYTGAIDGVWGSGSQRSWDLLVPPPQIAEPVEQPPWIEAALEVLGWHERTDNARLRAWLKRDGQTLGDPASLPWCGDFVDTALRIALPDEPRPGKLGENPYWALNWGAFGRPLTAPMQGAIGTKKRDGGGHVCFVVGQDGPDTVLCFGGNQGNTACVAAYPRSAFVAWRWPSTYRPAPQPLPAMSARHLPTSPSEF